MKYKILIGETHQASLLSSSVTLYRCIKKLNTDQSHDLNGINKFKDW